MFESVKNIAVGKFVSHGEWCHQDRTIGSYELIFATKGEVYINENNINYHLKADDILILQPNIRHFGYKHSADSEFFWLHWHGDADALSGIKYRKIENSYNMALYFRQLLSIRTTHKIQESMDYLTRLILMELYLNNKCTATNHTAEKIAAWIEANAYLPVTEKQVAAEFGYNADYLNRLFKKCFSKTLKQYMNEKRIEYIKGLMLRSNLPLKEIAIKSGFSEYKYFLKFFKYHEKITPTEFYRQYAKMCINSH